MRASQPTEPGGSRRVTLHGITGRLRRQDPKIRGSEVFYFRNSKEPSDLLISGSPAKRHRLDGQRDGCRPAQRGLRRAHRRLTWATGASLLLATGLLATPAANGPAAPADRYVSATDEPLVQYRALRRMHARNDKLKHEGWVEAWTELDERGFRYEVVSERGSEYVRNNVLKKMLAREQELIARGDTSRGELSPMNYEFSEPAEHTPGERHVLLKPKRKDELLVDGRMVLSPDGRELLRVEGRMARNPSFWTSLVNVVRRYARIGGVRVPVSIESTAKVRLAGASYMKVDYEYESVNGRRVGR
jgi:hypothetical protein